MAGGRILIRLLASFFALVISSYMWFFLGHGEINEWVHVSSQLISLTMFIAFSHYVKRLFMMIKQ